jgi:hypothetical protein
MTKLVLTAANNFSGLSGRSNVSGSDADGARDLLATASVPVGGQVCDVPVTAPGPVRDRDLPAQKLQHQSR